MRSFHLIDLPSNLVFVYLEDEFRKQFLETARQAFGSFKKLGGFVGYTDVGIIETFRVKNRFTKLSTIIKLANFLFQRGFRGFSPNEVEKKVVAYRGIGTSLIIRNPNFPLKEDKRMIRIFFHLLGDGYGGKYGAGKPFYRNYAKELLNEFGEDLKVFGEVPYIKRETIVEIPSVIGYILEHIYKINFESHKSFIPSFIYKLPKEIIAQGIKAFADDEASIEDSRIRFYSSNKKLLSGIKKLIIEKFPEFSGKIGEIRGSKSYLEGKKYINYSFSIFSGELQSYYNLIGFSHLEKTEILRRIIKRKERQWKRRNKDITKLLILQSLRDKDKMIKEISEDIGITTSIARCHFGGNNTIGILSLKEMDYVKEIGFSKTKAKFWGITDKGINFLRENEHKLNKFSIEGNISKSYLEIVRKSPLVTPSYVAKQRSCRNDTASKQLLKLYRSNYLKRNRHHKEEYKYILTNKGIKLLVRG